MVLFISFLPGLKHVCWQQILRLVVLSLSAQAAFRVGDLVVFTAVDGATLDSGLTAGTSYRVSAVAGNSVTIVAASDGSAVTINDDSADKRRSR